MRKLTAISDTDGGLFFTPSCVFLFTIWAFFLHAGETKNTLDNSCK